MTEKDLFAYKDAKRQLALARERLQEFASNAYSPSSPNLSGTHGGAGDPDKIGYVAQRHSSLEASLSEAKERYARVGMLMDRVAALLDDDEQEFFLCRYLLCLTWEQTKSKMHSSKDRLLRLKHGILDKIKNF